MRRATEKKVALIKDNEGKPDEERVIVKPINDVDKVVLDCLGKGDNTTSRTQFDGPDSFFSDGHNASTAASLLDPIYGAQVIFCSDMCQRNYK